MKTIDSNKNHKKIIWLLAMCTCLILVCEIALRVIGIIDFPVYHTNSVIGYIPAPNQSGAFLRKNRWEVNSKSMGTGLWRPNEAKDILLLGDSLVWGGNPLDQPAKLGPQLQEKLPEWRIWPASAGSWSILNEIAYLNLNPDVVQDIETIVWILNTGDFGKERSLWSSDLTHPREKPLSAIWYVANKYIFSRINFGSSAKSSEALDSIEDSTLIALSKKVDELQNKKILFILYPNKSELKVETDSYIQVNEKLEYTVKSCCKILDLRSKKDWNINLYRDNIHPSAKGNDVLAAIIAAKLAE